MFIENRLPTNVHKAHKVLFNPSDSVKLLGGCMDLKLRWEDPCRKGLQEALRGFASAEEAKVP